MGEPIWEWEAGRSCARCTSLALPCIVRREQGRGENKVTQSETIGTGVREGDGVKDGVWSSCGLPTALCPLPIFTTMILGQNKPRSFHFILFSSLFLVVLLLRTGRLGGLTLKRWETGKLGGVGECPLPAGSIQYGWALYEDVREGRRQTR